MSAHALCRTDRIIRIEDDLESIFYVLLYYAIRFLPHSANEEAVGTLLYDIFDDFSDGVKGISCGRGKFGMMKEGVINLTTITGGESSDPTSTEDDCLVFYVSPPSGANAPAVHPIHEIIDSCLDWFHALYSLDKAPPVAEDRQRKKTVVPGSLFAVMAAHSKNRQSRRATRRRDTPEKTKKRADNVRSHAALRNLLAEYPLLEGWPEEDKGEGKRPKGGYVVKESLVEASADLLSGVSRRSTKRSHADIDTGKPENAEADAQDNEGNDSEDNEDASREPGSPSRNAPKRVRRV